MNETLLHFQLVLSICIRNHNSINNNLDLYPRLSFLYFTANDLRRKKITESSRIISYYCFCH